MVAAPTMAGQLSQPGTQKRYRAPPRESRMTHMSVRHWLRALPAKLQFVCSPCLAAAYILKSMIAGFVKKSKKNLGPGGKFSLF